METFLRSFSCPCNGVHCTAAVQPVARLLNFVVAYFLRLVYKTITFLLGPHSGHHWGRPRCSFRQPSRLGSFRCDKTIWFLPRCMQMRSSDENSVCPSVYLSVTRVNCDKTVERSVQIYIPYQRTFSLVFWEEQWLVGGRPLLPEILRQPAPVGAKSPILNR